MLVQVVLNHPTRKKKNLTRRLKFSSIVLLIFQTSTYLHSRNIFFQNIELQQSNYF